MRKIAANYVFKGYGSFIKNGTLVLDDNNSVIDLIETNKNFIESEGVEFYNGIITPGFVNCHAHLELSHLKNKINKTSNLEEFIYQMINRQNFSDSLIEESALDADRLMRRNGIVACGDISNSSVTFNIKQKSNIYYHSFIEGFGLKKENNQIIINLLRNLCNEAKSNYNLSSSISPHASYSINNDLFNLLSKEFEGSIVSFHNQESKVENDLFSNNYGVFSEKLKILGWNKSDFPTTNKSSLQSLLHFFEKVDKLLLIHNVFTEVNDIEYVQNNLKNHFWVFCPKSNLYISNSLPKFELFENYTNVCIGTDSFASNDTLSILEEIKTIQNNSNISLEKILCWGTYNGARALNISNNFGTFEKGATPGVNLIENIDFQNFKLKEHSKITVLV